ncbi:MAG: MarR family transcriptional regulator [Acidobacteriota bacterium]|nr:MarR family transcriptional regulator [Acidobacteriota bacterium]
MAGRTATRPSGHTTEEIASALVSVARAMTQVRVHETLCRQAGVDVDRLGAAVLFKLVSEGGEVRVTELAYRLAIDAPAVTRKVQQLERAGLVRRQGDPADARASLLDVTAAGRRTIERLQRAQAEWMGERLAGWSAADRAELARLLQQLAATIAVPAEGRP